MTTQLFTFQRVRRIFGPIHDPVCLFTIGYEGLTIDRFIEKLLANDVRLLIDVRNNPISRKAGFSKTSFREHLQEAGIPYQHLPELGVPSALRKNLGSEDSYQSLFRYYEREILPANIGSIEKIKSAAMQYNRAALTCFEADPTMCHRHRITEYLSKDPTFIGKIVHLR